MPPRSSSSRKKSNRKLKKTNNKLSTSQPNRHSSPPLQSQGELDPNILREQNGNCPVKPNSDIKCQFLVVEEKHRKRGFSDTAGHNEMEGSLEKTQKVVEESGSEDKHVVGLDDEKVTTIVESDAAEVVTKTHQVQEEEGSSTVEQKEKKSSPLVELEPDTIRDASELKAELKEKESQGGDSQETEPPSEQTNEPSLALETETSREAEAAIEETTEAGADKLDSSEEKKESSSIETKEAVMISESSVPQIDVASRAIEETTPIVKPEETGETNLPAEEHKVEESTVVKESSKEEEEAQEPLPPSDVATAETTSTIVQEKTEMPTSTESQKSPEDPAPREHASWSSCCGIFDCLCR